jgi:hypothetical protein
MDIRSLILSASDLPQELVEIPEWGVSVWVRALTGAQRDSFEESCLIAKKSKRELSLKNVRAKLCCLTVYATPEDKVPVFAQADAEKLGEKSAKALDRIYEVAARLSGIREADIEELAGN